MLTLRPTVSLSEAEHYFGETLRSDVWDEADETEKLKSLTYASIIISGAFEFSSDAYSIDSDGAVTWQDNVLAAVCEEAQYLLSKDPSEIPAGLLNGISQASAGSVGATFDWSFVLPWICGSARVLIGTLGVCVADGAGYCRSQLLAL